MQCNEASVNKALTLKRKQYYYYNTISLVNYMSTDIFKYAITKLDNLVEEKNIAENDYMQIADALKKGYDATEENAVTTYEISDMQNLINSLYDEIDCLRDDLKCAYSLIKESHKPPKKYLSLWR